MTGPGHDLAHRVPKRVPTEQWEPPHGREVLERLLGALTGLQHDPLPVSLDVVQASLDSVIGEGAYPTGPTIQDLTGRLRDHLRELVPVLRKRAGSTARRRDAKALRRVECLLRAEDPLTMTQARQYLDDLATATRDMLCCLVIGLPQTGPHRLDWHRPSESKHPAPGQPLGRSTGRLHASCLEFALIAGYGLSGGVLSGPSPESLQGGRRFVGIGFRDEQMKQPSQYR
ncbi:DUF6415 family natural product biosynthesis protein [Streptomyces jumonjinensis]|uniref:DUF6415 family natural product biosynthesis protein n=1 Tax=Streptomyces jumonjinensis TaxID=1945 RepID=UPI00331E8F19